MKCQGCQSAKAQVWVAESEAALCNGCSCVMGDVTRYRLCALCDCNPARIFCHNDNAALCDGCDADIHLSNPLAVRHDREPLEPISAETVKEPLKECFSTNDSDSVIDSHDAFGSKEQRPADACAAIVTIPKADKDVEDFDVFDLDSTFFGKDLLDFGGFDQAPSSPGSDGVVPTMDIVETASSNASSQDLGGIDESPKRHKLHGFGFSQDTVAPMYTPAMPTIPSLGQRVPSLSPRSSYHDLPTLHIGADRAMDREARVMRYREKRKRRTFEKTIRYQSRKAYAEVRPRIKGRFATKEEVAAMKAAAATGNGSSALLTVCA